MVDEWGRDNSSSYSNGRSYGKGRGFALPTKNEPISHVGTSHDDFDWGSGSQSNNNNDDFNSTYENNDNYNSETAPDSNNFDNNQDFNANTTTETTNFGWPNDGDTQTFDNENKKFGKPRGRRNNDDRHKSDGDNEGLDDVNFGENAEKKPPVTYIPPERSMNDEDLFNSGVSAGINFSKYENIKVKVSGDDPPQPIETFDEAGLRTILLSNIKKSGYETPTPVQKNAIPILMSGRDVMACAQSGSGKTAAYLVPIINKLLEENDELRLTDTGCEPQVLILAPTRELVTQIWWEAEKFAKDTFIKAIAVYGGVATMHQIGKIQRGAHIIVATAGRLCDFVKRGRIIFSSIRFVILDEADRMLDPGFLTSMEEILNHETMVTKSERQTAMFSATFAKDVQNLARKFLGNYLFLRVGIVGGACENIEQNFYLVEKSKKRRKLEELLKLDKEAFTNHKTIVFVETKKTTDYIAAYMSQMKLPSTSIHGDREQKEREIALNDFKSGRMSILVATSVGSRGLDIPGITHVINYDLPTSIDDYVHRIGRTGRIGNEGKATSFYDPDRDSSLASELEQLLIQVGQPVPDFLQGNQSGFDGGVSNDFGGYNISDDNNFRTEVEPEEPWEQA